MKNVEELVAGITETENKIYELIDKGDPDGADSLREAKDLIHDLAETLRGVVKDADDLASRSSRHSRVNISGNNSGSVQIGNGCVQTNQF